jgi:AraC-like DNA-binding protein
MEDQKNSFVLSLLAYAAQRDVPVQQLCSMSGIDLKLLKTGSHPPVSKNQLSDLWLNASRLSNDPLFGLHFGESLQLAALGIVGEIIKSSYTVGDALTQAASLIHLISDHFRMEIKNTNQTFTVYLKARREVNESSFAFLQMRDLLMVFVIHELDGLLLEKIKPWSVKLSFESARVAEYERVLRCRPVNKANEYSLEFPASYWNETILSSNYALQSQLLQKVQSSFKAQKAKQTLQTRIKDYLAANAYLGVFSLEEVAANFNVSPRSLQRKLSKEGVTFQQLADEVKQTLAKHYLRSGNYQVKEISNMLGYNELSAFSRAFKRWTGKSPIEYQA